MGDVEQRNAESGREGGQTAKTTGTRGTIRSGTTMGNPEKGDMGRAARDYRDPHGNQSGREPEGGSGAGQSRGDESSFNPGDSSENVADTGPNEPAERFEKNDASTPERHDQPVEGGRDIYGTHAGDHQRS